ncbi:LysM peptidoglycan-binding domain-containing protein [Pedobacter sp. KR3-3]|uniref:LysM peptidoglycan-binding domain-containing protein n=1 Tax=Pedobacter albus TaxID=3113905 RepID=A0ABU7I572_9SPHI|nr:LysM peptidoglycan-binding domain-containing protein [Pedobacter sp. KR3-3]MEE1944615.1 LysM peptidoglycan-binding domain-containing protein [Pedobacter sp. KR3-3]
MYKLYKLFIVALFLQVSVAHANTAIDSIGVENYKGKKLILHKVEAKETYYSIARRYNVNYKDIMSFNDSKFLQIGVVVKVPTETPFATAATPVIASNTDNGALITYTIKAKDNLNMLAEKYGTTVNEIKRVNGLSSNNLQIGQQLKIPANGNAPVEETPAPVAQPTKSVANNTANTENTGNISHTIKAKENLNMLAEKYGTTVDEIKRLNGLTSSNLQIGQVLRIPSANGNAAPAEAPVEAPKVAEAPPVKSKQKKTEEAATPPSPTVSTDGGFEHTVVAGETIYTIAKKYSLTTFQLKTWNNLASNDLTTGQKLIIKGAKPVAALADDDQGSEANPNTLKEPSFKGSPSKFGITQYEEKGTALWITDNDLDPSKMLVLHRTAPIGTIIKVTNPMSNRSAFAKVVGKFTENESTKDVIIVMTKAVADAVGALDKRFFCNINYGAQDNEQ